MTIIVPFTAGTTADIMGRGLAQYLSETLGQSFVIDNRGGAAGNIGAATVARAPQDGYTLLLATTGQAATNKLMYQNMSFDPETRLRAGHACRQVAGSDHRARGCAVFDAQGVYRLRSSQSG